MSTKAERLVNLTVALLDADRPLAFDEIRRKLPGYDHPEPESARRMFERDKDDLRSLGVPIETVRTSAHDSDAAYRIDRTAYELPPIELDPRQVAALGLALHLTQDHRVQAALSKLAGIAPDPEERATPATRIRLPGPELDPIAEALTNQRAIGFGYRAADGVARHRSVDPYGIVHRHGAWYLVGRDHERDATRSFRLDRMTTDPEPTGEPGAFEPPDDLDVATVVEIAPSDTVDAIVALSPRVAPLAAAGGEVQRRRRDGWTVVLFSDQDPHRLLPRVLALGADAEVLRPKGLRDETADRLRRLAR